MKKGGTPYVAPFCLSPSPRGFHFGFGALAVEFVLIRQELTMAIARRLPIVDAVLGVSAGVLVVIGMLRVFFFEKGAAYYFHSHAFMTKLSIFIAVALLSIIPTIEFLSWAQAGQGGRAAGRERTKVAICPQYHSRRIGRSCRYPALRCDHGAWWLGIAVHQWIGDALPVDYALDVTHAYNGIECLNALDDGVDLAFIDVHMPTDASPSQSP